MGWSSGSELFDEVILAIQPAVPDAVKRQAVYYKLITAFEAQDWDTQDECLGKDPAFDAALKEMYPD